MVWIILAALLALPASALAQKLDDPGSVAERQATQTVAERALRQFDNALWDASWDLTGTYLRTLIDREHWPSAVATLRGGLGAIQSRQPDTIGFGDHLDGAPDARYGVLTFQSRFEHQAVREKVVLAHEGGVWKLAGYFVLRPRAQP